MSQSFYMTKLINFHLSSIILIIYGGRYNLGSYTLCSFLQYLITFGHKILQTDQHCSQIQSTVFPQCHRPSFTPTVMKILCKHTHSYISTVMLSESRKQNTTLQSCSTKHCSKLISYQFFILLSLFLKATPKYFKFPNLIKFQTMYQLGHVFFNAVISPLCL